MADTEIGYDIVGVGDRIYVTHGFTTSGPFSSVRRAQRYIAERCAPKPEKKIIESYNSKGQLIYDATRTARR